MSKGNGKGVSNGKTNTKNRDHFEEVCAIYDSLFDRVNRYDRPAMAYAFLSWALMAMFPEMSQMALTRRNDGILEVLQTMRDTKDFRPVMKRLHQFLDSYEAGRLPQVEPFHKSVDPDLAKVVAPFALKDHKRFQNASYASKQGHRLASDE